MRLLQWLRARERAGRTVPFLALYVYFPHKDHCQTVHYSPLLSKGGTYRSLVFRYPVWLSIHTFYFLSHGDPTFEVSKHQCTLKLTHTCVMERCSIISILQHGKQGTEWLNNLLTVKQQTNSKLRRGQIMLTPWSPAGRFRAFPTGYIPQKRNNKNQYSERLWMKADQDFIGCKSCTNSKLGPSLCPWLDTGFSQWHSCTNHYQVVASTATWAQRVTVLIARRCCAME